MAFKRIHAIISGRCQHFLKEIRTDLDGEITGWNQGTTETGGRTIQKSK